MKTVLSCVVLILLLGLSVIGCAAPPAAVGNQSPSAPAPAVYMLSGSDIPLTPKPAMPSIGFSIPEPEYFVLDADTAAIGTVTKGSAPPWQDSSDYSYWRFNVEEYIIKPLSEKTLQIRIWESSWGRPIKGVHLRENEHLLLFLKWEGDSFVISGGMGSPGKFTVEDGRIRYQFYGGSPWRPLDKTIARIKAVAETWAGESTTPEGQTQVVNIALEDSSLREFLLGREYEVFFVSPYLADFVSGQIRYLVHLKTPNQRRSEADLVIIVNATTKKVDRLRVEAGQEGFTKEDKSEAFRIALADATVQKILETRGSLVFDIRKDSWHEEHDGKMLFYIFPVVELFLYPRGSENLEIFVDLNQKKVVKIFIKSLLSPKPLESSITKYDFDLTLRIPKTEYSLGETAEATMTLSYHGDGPAQLSAPNGIYLDMGISDAAGNLVYRWSDEKYLMKKYTDERVPLTPALPTYPPTPQPAPPPTSPQSQFSSQIKEQIMPGWSFTQKLEFRATRDGTLYLTGYTFHGFNGQVLVSYPGGSGMGVNNMTPYLVIHAR